MVGIYCAAFVVYCMLCKEKNMEQFNTERTASWGKKSSWCSVD